MTSTPQLRRPQAVALDLIVQTGRARISNATDPAAGTVSRRTAESLERLGLVHVLEVVAVATDAGKHLAADGIDLPPRRYDHGTHACFVLDGCRCTPCKQAHAAYEAERHRDELYGRPRLIDAQPVRDHIAMLRDAGIGLKTVAAKNGVAHGALWKLVYGAPDRKGPSKKVRRATAEKILALGPGDLADGARVPAEGTWRRINQMLEGGFCKAEIGRHIHGPHAKSLQLSRKTVTVANARAVAALHAAWAAGDIAPEGRRSRWQDQEAADDVA